MKYVIFETKHFDLPPEEIPIVFPEAFVHADIARGARMLFNGDLVEPVSAGFCSFPAAGVKVEGMSESLGIKSRPEDADVIAGYYKMGEPADQEEDSDG